MTAISDSEIQATTRRSLQTQTLWRVIFRVISYGVLIGGGTALVIAFAQGHYLPVRVSVVGLFMVSIITIACCRFAPFSPLTRLMIVLYVSPFAICLGYLADERYVWWYTPLAILYITDPVVDEIMLMLALIGVYGMAVGYVFAAARRMKMPRGRGVRTLKVVPFMLTLFAGVFFSYLNAPSSTIFSAVYTAEGGLAERFNFNAAYLVSYTLLMMLFVDAEQERHRPFARRWKRIAVLAVTLYILLFFQLLRGDRDSFGYLLGLAAIFLTEWLPPDRMRRTLRRRFAILSIFGAAVLASFFALGSFRTSVAVHDRIPFGTALIDGVKRGFTGTGVLLTNLSQAHSFRVGEMAVEGGKTYADYLRSLPPGFVTYALGIERPIEMNRGPNFWFKDISAGGIHVVTVPFKNFLAPGAFLIMLLYGYLIARWEIIGQRPAWLARLWYGSLFVVSAQWFWYGDISFIRELMIFALAAAGYAIVRRVGAFSVPADR